MNALINRARGATYSPGSNPGTAGSTGVDSAVTTLAELAAIPTVNLVLPVVKIWVQAADGTTQVWRLVAGTTATGDGVQRPADYSAANARIWLKAAS